MAKLKNVSIRFDNLHLEYALKKTGLVKEQALVDYLLMEFWNIGNKKVNPFKDVEVKKVKDLTPPKTNYTIDTKPPRLEGESAIDYAIRMATK